MCCCVLPHQPDGSFPIHLTSLYIYLTGAPVQGTLFHCVGLARPLRLLGIHTPRQPDVLARVTTVHPEITLRGLATGLTIGTISV